MERPDLWSLHPWTLEERGFYALAALGTLLLAGIPFSLLPPGAADLCRAAFLPGCILWGALNLFRRGAERR